MIQNGANTPLNQTPGGLPNVGQALGGWFRPMTFVRVTKVTTGFRVVETTVTVNTRGVRQPMAATQLVNKPEGERSWKWDTLHVTPDCVLCLDDKVIFNGVQFRVRAKGDYAEYGYLTYDIVESQQ